MTLQRVLFPLALLLLLTGASCARRFELFELRLVDGSGTRLRENPARSPDEEGYVEPGSLFELAPLRPAAVPEGAVLVLSFVGPASGIEAATYDEEGNRIASARLSVAAPSGASWALAVDAGEKLGSFTVAAGEGHGTGARLIGAELMVLPPGAGLVSLASHEALLLSGPDAVVEAWSAPGSDGDGRVWQVRRTGSWRPDAPLAVEYRYTPAAGDGRAEVAVPVARIEAGGRRFALDLRPGARSVTLYPAAEGIDVDRVSIRSAEKGLEILRLSPRPPPATATTALPVDLGTLLRYPAALWRHSDFEVFSWSLYPSIVWIDSRDYAVQDRFFRRLAYYVEKAGFRGRILENAELAGRHGYNAHNYRAEDLARFFNAAAAAGTGLYAEEELLREVLIENGVLIRDGAQVAPGIGGVLGISQQSHTVPSLRELLIAHEAYHGVYYSEPRFVTAVDRLWEGLSDDERHYWHLLLAGMQYDVADSYLVRNEFQAYLLQQPVAAADWYFEVRAAGRIRGWFPNSVPWLDGFLARYRGTFRRQAAAVQAVLFETSGLVARDVFCLEVDQGARVP